MAAESRFPVGSSAKIKVGLGDQRAGAGHSLLLAARELAGTVPEPVGDAELVHQVAEPVPVELPPGDVDGQGDVLGGGQRRDEIEGLEDEPDPVPAQPGQTSFVEPADVEPADEALARGRAVQAGQAVHERRLAGSGRTHHRGEAALFEGHVDAGQRVQRRRPGAVGLAQVDRLGGRRGGHAAMAVASGAVVMIPRIVGLLCHRHSRWPLTPTRGVGAGADIWY